MNTVTRTSTDNWPSFYNPVTGRFLSEDPIGLKGEDTNFYRYTWNGPLSTIDPTGNGGLSYVVRPFIPPVSVPMPEVGIGDIAKKVYDFGKDLKDKYNEAIDFINKKICQIDPSRCKEDTKKSGGFPDKKTKDLVDDVNEASTKSCPSGGGTYFGL